MLYLDWKISLSLIGIGILSAVLVSLFSRQLRVVSDAIQRRLGARTARLLDVIVGVTDIKMLNIHAIVTRKFNRVNEGLVQLEKARGYRVAKLESVNYLITFINFGGVFAVGGVMMANGMIGMGTLTALVQLSLSVSLSFSQIGGTIAQLQTSLAGFRRLAELFAQTEKEVNELPIPLSAKRMPFSLSFNNVSFQYLGEERLALRELNFHLEGTGITAFVGKSGSGKSTIAKLLLGMYPPNKGEILFNNEPLRHQWLEQISYVPQKVFLFEGTIEENIRMGNLEASREDIIRAAFEANAHTFIMELEDDYSSKIVDGGSNLSGGQKQRIALARALVRETKLLVLDEATSALDSTTETLIHQAIAKIAQTRKVVVITHNLKRIMEVDQVLVMDNGRIVCEGSANQLRNSNSHFQNLLSII
jgi:ATP-binding cassette subfamily B protein